jgi:hypothetical protein
MGATGGRRMKARLFQDENGQLSQANTDSISLGINYRKQVTGTLQAPSPA